MSDESLNSKIHLKLCTKILIIRDYLLTLWRIIINLGEIGGLNMAKIDGNYKFRTLLLTVIAAVVTSCSSVSHVPPASNNLFASLLGKSEAEVQARIDSLWQHFFTSGDMSKYDADGEKTVYYEVDDSMGIIVDTGSNDVRTEGMSYGMMISVQLDKREVFDRLWRWAKTYMAYPADSPWDGYFCWQCGLDGTKIGQSNASDGEIYFVTALFLAADRWNEPQYAADANDILHKVTTKDGRETGVYNLYDDSTRLVTFVPNEEVHWYSDPSYCLPAFLDLWAEKADSKNDFWHEAANKARWLLEVSQDSVTGLYPDYCLFNGQPYRRPAFAYNTDRYQYDAIRCAMNTYSVCGRCSPRRANGAITSAWFISSPCSTCQVISAFDRYYKLVTFMPCNRIVTVFFTVGQISVKSVYVGGLQFDFSLMKFQERMWHRAVIPHFSWQVQRIFVHLHRLTITT